MLYEPGARRCARPKLADRKIHATGTRSDSTPGSSLNCIMTALAVVLRIISAGAFFARATVIYEWREFQLHFGLGMGTEQKQRLY